MHTAPSSHDEAPSQRRVERRWVPTLVVLAVIAFVSGGSRMVGGALTGPPGPPLDVGGVVAVHPAPGWEIEGRSENGGLVQALLTRGAARLLVATIEGYGRPVEELVIEYARDVLDERFAQLTIGEAARDGAGRMGFGYVGVSSDGIPVEGIVISEVAPSGNAVVFDGFAPEGDLAATIDDLRRMAGDAEVV